MTPVTIHTLGHRGDGVADGPDGPLYVAGVLPGETVSGRPDGERLRDVRVLDPAPQRVTPPCPHAGACGGCALQHAGDAFVADWKLALLRRALAGVGLTAPLRPLHVSPPGARRRVTLAARRTRKTAIIGFHGRARDAIAPIETCLVAHPVIVAALPDLRALTRLVGSRDGVVRLTVTHGENGLDVAVEGAKAADVVGLQRLADWAAAADVARLALGRAVVAKRRPPWQPMGRAQVTPPPGGFLQATADGEAALVAAVREALDGARTVADLYCGAGAFALPLAETAQVTAMDADAGAVAALDAGWRAAPGLRTVRAQARDLAHRPMLPDEMAALDGVVFDPPRAGAAAQVAQIAAARPRRVAAVSCNPATLARDLRVLADAGYRLDWAQPVDQFRWSPHLEVAVALSLP